MDSASILRTWGKIKVKSYSVTFQVTLFGIVADSPAAARQAAKQILGSAAELDGGHFDAFRVEEEGEMEHTIGGADEPKDVRP